MSEVFFLALAGLLVIGAVDVLFFLSDQTVFGRVPLLQIMRLVVFKLPSVLLIFLPLAVLFSILIVWIRMFYDNEWLVFNTSGVSGRKILGPILLASIGIACCSFVFSDRVVPKANTAYIREFNSPSSLGYLTSFLSQIVFKLDQRFFYVQRSVPEKQRLESVLILDPSGEGMKITTAQYVNWTSSGEWHLYHGHSVALNSDGGLLFNTRFKKAIIPIHAAITQSYLAPKTFKEMTAKELMHQMGLYRQGGLKTTALKVELGTRVMLALACVAFACFGVGICVFFLRKSWGWWGIITTISVSLVGTGFYFFLISLFRNLALQGHFSVEFLLLIPNLFLVLMAVVLSVFKPNLG